MCRALVESPAAQLFTIMKLRYALLVYHTELKLFKVDRCRGRIKDFISVALGAWTPVLSSIFPQFPLFGFQFPNAAPVGYFREIETPGSSRAE